MKLSVLSGTMTVDDLRHLTRTKRPVVCPVTLPDGNGHWVVVRGVLRGRVHIHCPIFGPHAQPVAAWLSRWYDSTSKGHEYDRWGICPATKEG